MYDLKKELFDEYKYKFEFHCHSNPASHCSDFKCEDLADIFISDGYDGIALTNHFTPTNFDNFDAKGCVEFYLNDYKTVKAHAEDKLSVCLGMEIRFTENINDYLVYGISENDIEKLYYYIPKGLETFYKEFKNDKNVIIQAHPFRKNMSPIRPEFVDGIEAFNMHPGHNAKIALARKYAKEHNMLITGGVDFHHEMQRGIFTARLKTLPKNSFEVAEIIKSQDIIYAIGDSIILP